MKVIPAAEVNPVEVASVLAMGGLIVYPTETVYGLGVDATSDAAMEKLWKFKGERGDKPVLVAVSSVEMAEEYTLLSETGKKVVQKYWPGPVAVVASSKNLVSKKAQGLTDTLGLRNPDNVLVRQIIFYLRKPITSTSANISGAVTGRSLSEFLETVPADRQKLIDLFIDAGELPVSLPSTIVDTTGEGIKILRQGDVNVEI